MTVSCRDFVLDRAKAFCGKKFKHKGTGHIIETDRFTWNVQVAKCFGGLHVACGGYVVWSASWGWFCEPCN